MLLEKVRHGIRRFDLLAALDNSWVTRLSTILTFAGAAGVVWNFVKHHLNSADVWTFVSIGLLAIGIALHVASFAGRRRHRLAPESPEPRLATPSTGPPKPATGRPTAMPFAEWLASQREQGRWIRDQLDPPKRYLVSPAATWGGIFFAQLEQRARVWATTVRARLRNDAPQRVTAFDNAGPDLPDAHRLAGVVGTATRENLIGFMDGKLAVLDDTILTEQKGIGQARRALLTWLGEKIEQFQGLRAAIDQQVALPVPTMAATDRIQTGFWHLEDEIVTRLQLEAPEWIDYYDETPDWFHPGLTLVTSEQFGRLSRFIGYKAERLRHIKAQLS